MPEKQHKMIRPGDYITDMRGHDWLVTDRTERQLLLLGPEGREFWQQSTTPWQFKILARGDVVLRDTYGC